jgi:uncharacterized protein
MKWLRSSDFQIMPWKNGLGSTAEIAIYPPGSQVSDSHFLWRFSAATVSADGPFSQFPGYDRLLTVVDGKGLRLNERTLKSGEVDRFSGEEKIDCLLIEGTVLDLGLIFRRGKIQAQMRTLKPSKFESFVGQSDISFLYCLKGSGPIAGFDISAHDVLCLNRGDCVELAARSEWMVIEIFYLPSEA